MERKQIIVVYIGIVVFLTGCFFVFFTLRQDPIEVIDAPTQESNSNVPAPQRIVVNRDSIAPPAAQTPEAPKRADFLFPFFSGVLNVQSPSLIPDESSVAGDSGFLNKEVEIFAGRYPVSPFAGRVVFLDRNERLRATAPEREYVTLRVSDSVDLIDMTDWKLFSFSEKKAYRIPRGTQSVQKGRVTEIGILGVTGGDYVVISSGRSPLGVSFRSNKCLGYRQQFKNFYPPLKERCPDPETEIERNGVSFTDITCHDYTRSLNRCETVLDFPSRISFTPECKIFLKEFANEEGCVDIHKNDVDFFDNEVRFYLNSEEELWRSERDAIFLIDREGRLVDVLEF